jgi:hypothetical protein
MHTYIPRSNNAICIHIYIYIYICRAESIARSSNSAIPGPVPSELIVGSNLSIGKRLLGKMLYMFIMYLY